MHLSGNQKVKSLFLLHVGSNAGYAIAPLERLFAEVGLILSESNPECIHFAYPSLQRGRPDSLPPELTNIIEFDFHAWGREQQGFLEDYVRKHSIHLVLGFDLPATSSLFPALRRGGVKTILSYWGAPMSSEMPAWKLLLKRVAFATSRTKLDGLIFESRAMARLAIKGRGVPESMVDVVPLGIDVQKFSPAKSDYIYQVFPFPKESRVVIYSGHMEARKGVKTLVEAAIELLHKRKRTDVSFLLCGNAGDQAAPYEAMYQHLPIAGKIRFGGYRSDLPSIYPGCLCGVIPSTGWDSFPRTSLEMAACGLPVVASRLQGLPEAVLDGKTGLLFEPGNATQLADCIETLLDNPTLAVTYGDAGRQRCEKELTLDCQRERLLSIMRKRLA